MSAPAAVANLITIGARDFPKLRAIYRDVAWPQIINDEEFAAFDLRGLFLALFPIADSPAMGTPNQRRAAEASASQSGSWSTPQQRSIN